jgi:hypothetical protein
VSSAVPAGFVQRTNGKREESIALPPGAPWKWELDGHGRPIWIPTSADSAWATVFEWELILGHLVHVEMPVLTSLSRNGNGHAPYPPNEIARRAAGLRDLYRCSNEYIARQLSLTKADSDEPNPRAAKGQVREGRSVLHAAGVLPWAAFGPAGRLPKRWWREATFLGALGDWRRQAVSALPARTMGDTARDALTMALRVERDLLLLAPALIRRAVPRR